MKYAALLLAASLTAAPIQGRAEVRTIEVHDSWGMICQPSNGDAFLVLMTDSTHTLMIGSRSGKRRNNQVISSASAGHGFKVTAMGKDQAGKTRMIEAFFSAQGGYLTVLDRNDPPIPCDPDRAASND